eukprot:gnl/Dysnectes_brevis/3230_a4040_915.p1 GENE.gnl/Dysnectes_brevis/3230_a4040_915~~gnl/Dysnectes_brevis/3230_a4040_915.p1  ORF type:complete len:254 (-),score=-10.17 gnl/Dysnectes_brevis/3230_a4040_915:44-805(-)
MQDGGFITQSMVPRSFLDSYPLFSNILEQIDQVSSSLDAELYDQIERMTSLHAKYITDIKTQQELASKQDPIQESQLLKQFCLQQARRLSIEPTTPQLHAKILFDRVKDLSERFCQTSNVASLLQVSKHHHIISQAPTLVSAAQTLEPVVGQLAAQRDEAYEATCAHIGRLEVLGAALKTTAYRPGVVDAMVKLHHALSTEESRVDKRRLSLQSRLIKCRQCDPELGSLARQCNVLLKRKEKLEHLLMTLNDV